MSRRLDVVVCAVLALAPVASAETADSSLRRPTIEAVFETKELAVEELDNLMWLPDNAHVIYWTSMGESRSIHAMSDS